MSQAREYLDRLAGDGRFDFTLADARKALGGAPAAVRAVLRRLKARGEIATPHRGFHVIVPPEYRRLGCIPPEQFLPHLMEHLGLYYHVALLSAAQHHGAAHHQPQALQVMLERNRRPIHCGKVRVEFAARRDARRAATVQMQTPRGPLRVASPETTALELVGYADRCGGLDNVATVLVELAGRLDGARLAAAARAAPVVWAQRLGYLLELVRQRKLAAALAPHVQKHASAIAPLVRSKSTRGSIRAERWKLAVNAKVEPDL